MKHENNFSQLKVKEVFRRSLQHIKEGKKPNISGNMRAVGYAKTSAHALKVTQTKTWQRLLAQIDDQMLLDRLTEIALDPKDKRASLVGITELLKLKDRYPDKKVRLGTIEEQQDVFE